MPRTKRKDKSRAVLRTGESQRADGTYQFRWTDSNHKRFCVYAKTLDELRYKEEQIKKDKSDGIKAEARYTTVNEVYELWKELKRGPVSYTHLDVYKRQGKSRGNDCTRRQSD